ncbi:TIGR03766 family XrtG-associated glycosyltransferase [Liquorilactobacillus capillatus]|uniref:Integral membrane protein n=1 Tax=Liquorilactobacillus capillatus DSM 19910 TaxID=1423731 RepID=A0A0R1M8F3_9LACO|nr:TIGR03766 family XrtG-associated glycosyltransferase [Liquorilactobacillus capillatus]KRL00986.1 integral membrane protein [Liquorilactobacillus capillatus DSM 19910]
MSKRLLKIANAGKLRVFGFFIFITFIFALTSPNLILGDNQITGAGTTFFTTVWLLIAGVIIVCFKTFKAINQFLHYLLITHKLKTSLILLALVIVWQLIFVLLVHPAIGFDVGAVHQALTDRTSAEIRAYYSINYNNLPLLLVQHFLAEVFATKSWLFFDLVTLILVDLAMVFNLITVALVDRTRLAAAVYLHAGWLFLFPMIIVPYTDTWVLPLVSGYLMCYSIVKRCQLSYSTKLIALFLGCFLLVVAYFLKPSAIIGGVAIGLVELVSVLVKPRAKKQGRWLVVGTIFLSGVLILTSYHIFKQRLQDQRYIQVDSARAIPAIHFISMGLSGEGGYNPKDALAMAQIPTKAGRVTYSKKLLVRRLKEKGFSGYLVFLFQKHRANTADGTFAWVKEGHFITENPQPARQGMSGQLKQFVYLYGTRLGDFRFAAQCWWIILLGMIALGWRERRDFVQLLRLALIGSFMYLLIFEGGRSRYLIQFLPYFLILAALVSKQSFLLVQKLGAFLSGTSKSLGKG